MRILMLSWRYAGHPQAGGAEVVTHEVLRRLAASGDDVTVFTASYPGAAPVGDMDGVTIIRRGVQWSVHAHAWLWLRRRWGNFDRVVEQINTLPFLTPLYVPEAKRRLLIHQLAREYWWRETRGVHRLAAPLGYALEPLQVRVYRETNTMTISASSRDDLVRFGIPSDRITLLPMAVHTAPVANLTPRVGPPRCIIVGRLTPAKFVEEGVEAFARVQAELPNARLDVIGSGDERYRARLEALVARRRLRNVVFHGRVSEERKRELLVGAHLHLFTSHREGWGLTVTEAAVVGTPTIGYDAPGVRDSVADHRLLSPIGDVEALAAAGLRVLADAAVYDEVRTRAWQSARALSWERTTQVFREALD